jgi:hypothetical protein
MTDYEVHEVCAVCAKDTSDGRWFCHFYGDHSRLTFCTPHCAEVFLHRDEAAPEWDAKPPPDPEVHSLVL